jgi:iron complex outermembrane receptor protein
MRSYFHIAFRSALLTGAGCASLVSGAAQAQTSGTPPLPTANAPATASPDVSAATPAQDNQRTEDIVVTANKRSENAQNVPIAITALNNEQLRSAGVTSTEDLKATVPALNITVATSGFGLPRIRGIGSTGVGPGIENPVAVYVDGVYYGSAFGNLQSLYDIEQVAVLKGPQGTLFGRNATGGLIQISTLGPSFNWTGRGEIGYGNFDTVSAAGYVSGGLSDTVAISLSGQYENRAKGFGKNLFTGNDIQDARSWSGRAKLLWQPGPDTKVTLAGDFNGRNSTEPAFRAFSTNSLGQNVTQQIITLGGDPNRDIYADTDPFLRARQIGSSLTVSQKFGGVTFKSITAYRYSELRTVFDPDGTTIKQLVIDNFNYDRQITQEFNLISNSPGPFKWVLGGFYMHDSAGLRPSRTTGLFTFGNNGFSDNINNIKLNSFAAFAEGTYALDASTNLTAGLRYTTDKRDLTAQIISYNGNINTTTTGALTESSKTFSKLTWRATLDHRFSPELLVYASYNRGFRSGTFIPQATPILLLQPEVVDAFEIGLKSDLFDRHVRFNLAGYYYTESNIQVQQIIAGVQNVYTADGAHIYGLDADVQIRVSNNLRLFGGVNYTHARYTNFTNAIVTVPFPLPAGFVIPTGQSCLGTFGNPFTQVGGNCLLRGDASGHQLQNTPEFTASIGGSLDVPTSIGKFTLAGNYYYNGGFFGDADNRVRQNSYNTVDASLTWRPQGDKFFVRVWGKNLTDAYSRSQIGATNTADNGTNAAPRTYGGSVGFDF